MNSETGEAITFNRCTLRSMFGVGLIVAGSVLVHAHMVLQKSEPTANAVLTSPPSEVHLTFNEAPDLKVSKMDIKGLSGQPKLVNLHVTDKSLMAAVQGDMPDGAYTVLWQAAGDDGHMQKGEVPFNVKR